MQAFVHTSFIRAMYKPHQLSFRVCREGKGTCPSCRAEFDWDEVTPFLQLLQLPAHDFGCSPPPSNVELRALPVFPPVLSIFASLFSHHLDFVRAFFSCDKILSAGKDTFCTHISSPRLTLSRIACLVLYDPLPSSLLPALVVAHAHKERDVLRYYLRTVHPISLAYIICRCFNAKSC
jgi:hypothetical protein